MELNRDSNDIRLTPGYLCMSQMQCLHTKSSKHRSWHALGPALRFTAIGHGCITSSVRLQPAQGIELAPVSDGVIA